MKIQIEISDDVTAGVNGFFGVEVRVRSTPRRPDAGNQ